MINIDNFRMLSNDEKLKYEFEVCEICTFYPCELVNEYMMNESSNSKAARVKAREEQIRTSDEKLKYGFETYETCEFNPCELVNEDTINESSDSKEAEIEEQIQTSDQTPDTHDVILPNFFQDEFTKNCSIKSFTLFAQVECGRQRVADGIGNDYKINTRNNFKIESQDDKLIPEQPDKWEPRQPVFISAQTGQGKNYFIENKLIPYIRELNYRKKTNQKVLILSNRVSLKLQTQSRLDGYDFDEENTIYSYGECVDVMSYQSLLNKIDYLKRKQQEDSSCYIFIVCDEAHFFTSDAMFNPDTDEILSALIDTFSNAVRIYMTATPYECIDYIAEYEKETCVFYHFQRNYDYLNTKYFSDHDELINIIVKSREKWLIFIDNIERGRDFRDKLNSEFNKPSGNVNEDDTDEPKKSKQKMKEYAYAIEADSKNEQKYQEMILNEKFDKETKVLIATSVIDNGVNFRGINNIVISETSKSKCLQMVGRGRVDGDDDKINLYIKRHDERYIENILNHLKKQQDAYHSYDLAYPPNSIGSTSYEIEFRKKYYNNRTKDWENAKHWFGINKDHRESMSILYYNTPLHFNKIARSMVDTWIQKYEFILEEMRRTNNNDDIIEPKVSGQKYLERQLSWFGKIYSIENDITLKAKEKGRNELIEFLKKYANSGKQMLNDYQDIFCKEFTDLHDEVFPRQDPNKERVYKFHKINDILEKLDIGYKVVASRETTGDRQTYWKIVKVN